MTLDPRARHADMCGLWSDLCDANIQLQITVAHEGWIEHLSPEEASRPNLLLEQECFEERTAGLVNTQQIGPFPLRVPIQALSIPAWISAIGLQEMSELSRQYICATFADGVAMDEFVFAKAVSGAV